MFMYVFSIIIIVASNVLYNICAKSTPSRANPFAALIVTYVAAAVLSFIAFIFTRSEKNFIQSLGDLNWASLVLAVAILGLEFGYLMAYRAGWNISIGSLVANIALAVILVPVGILLYKEGFSINKVFGIGFCIVGLVLINR